MNTERKLWWYAIVENTLLWNVVQRKRSSIETTIRNYYYYDFETFASIEAVVLVISFHPVAFYNCATNHHNSRNQIFCLTQILKTYSVYAERECQQLGHLIIDLRLCSAHVVVFRSVPEILKTIINSKTCAGAIVSLAKTKSTNWNGLRRILWRVIADTPRR